MIAMDIMTKLIPALQLSDSGDHALTVMQSHTVTHLPVVDQGVLLGLVSEEEILSHKLQDTLESHDLSVALSYVHLHEHVFNIMSKVVDRKLSLIPVLDDNSKYIGYILSSDLLQYFASSYSFAETGGILVIETDKSNYQLSEVSRVVEQENAVILSSFVTTRPNSNKVWITMKLNKTDLQYIKASLERYDYLVSTFYQDEKVDDSLQENYDALMKYLSI